MSRADWVSAGRLLTLLLLSVPAPVSAEAQEPSIQTYELDGFVFEEGGSIGAPRVAYATYGRLNAARDNAVLLPSYYGGRATDYSFLIGVDRALNPDEYFIVATEMFGSGGSSSPSNTPAPFDGPRFPAVTIRDDVEATRRLLRELFGVDRLRAVVGFSMGAQQAFQWAVSHPSEVDAIVALAGTAKTYPHGRVRLGSAISALRADPRWNDGDYVDVPTDGLRAWAEHWASWMYSQEWWRLGLYRERGYATAEEFVADRVRVMWNGMNLNDAVVLAQKWQEHDVSQLPEFSGDIERALASMMMPVLYMPSATDLYFPLTDAEYEQAFIPQVRFRPIDSFWGHTAGAGSSPEDAAFINREVRAFLAEVIDRGGR